MGIVKKIIQIIFLFLFLNCSSNIVKLYNPKKENFNQVKIIDSVSRYSTSESCGYHILILFNFDINERHQRAYNYLSYDLSSNEVILELSIQEAWTYILIGTKYCTLMKAKIGKLENISNLNHVEELPNNKENSLNKK